MKVTTGKNRSRSVTFNNYFGIGVDAQVSQSVSQSVGWHARASAAHCW
jgi:hypothetical protein